MKNKELIKQLMMEHRALLEKWQTKYGIRAVIPSIKLKKTVVTEEILYEDDKYYPELDEEGDIKDIEGDEIDVSEKDIMKRVHYFEEEEIKEESLKEVEEVFDEALKKDGLEKHTDNQVEKIFKKFKK